MTEKRFIQLGDTHIKDTITGKKYYAPCEQDLLNLLNDLDADLMMAREKSLYWRNKAEDIWGDMRTNIELEQENQRLKSKIKELDKEVSACYDTIHDLESELATYKTKFLDCVERKME